jgi:hypothetical protein
MTIRERIDSYRSRLLSGADILGDEASQMLVELSALVGNVNDEILEREMTYNRQLNELLSTPEMTAAKARIRANASEDYEALVRAKNYLVLVTQMIQAIKYRLRSLDEERRASGNL